MALPLFGEGQVIHLGRSIGFVEAKLIDAAGALVARATSSVRLVPSEKALNSPVLDRHGRACPSPP